MARNSLVNATRHTGECLISTVRMVNQKLHLEQEYNHPIFLLHTHEQILVPLKVRCRKLPLPCGIYMKLPF